MHLRPGRHVVGPPAANLTVHTFRDGVAQKVGHDLVFTVRRWEATVAVEPDGRCSRVELDADPESLEITSSANGVKPLSARDRAQIARVVEERVLGGRPIAFKSHDVEHAGSGLTISGRLSLAGAERTVRFDIPIDDGGRIDAAVPLVQTQWGIRPYSALMGALKLRDAVEVRLALQLPLS